MEANTAESRAMDFSHMTSIQKCINCTKNFETKMLNASLCPICKQKMENGSTN